MDAEEDDDDNKKDKKAEDAKEDDDEEKEGAKSTIKDKAKDGVTKAAMDAALEAATSRVRETERGIRVALAEVEPWVGRLAPTLALDSATDVYRHAAAAMGVKGAKTLHPDALWPVIQAQPKPGDKPNNQSRSLALDSTSFDDAAKYAPGLERITVGA